MFPPFPEELARSYALQIKDSLPECLNGKMIGVLVCKDSEENLVYLKAFSGQVKGNWLLDGFVPPLLDVDSYNNVVAKNDKEIHILSAEIESLEQECKILLKEQESVLKENPKNATRSNPAILIQHKIQEKKSERRKLSNESLKAIYNLFRVHCIDSSVKTFKDIFGDFLPPTGTGECCAPKLLNYAFKCNLHPVSLCEFYYGKGIRQEGIFIPPAMKNVARF